MTEPKAFVERLEQNGFSFYTGVPDSLLKDLCAYVTEKLPASHHVIAANEGAAVGLATGYHLATGKPAVVYMQNSGTGNAINPLLSLADPDVYSIPMLVVIGWRGEPGVKDEPQHVKQGAVQEALIASLGYDYEIMADEPEAALLQLDRLATAAKTNNSPVLLLVRKAQFAEYKLQASAPSPYGLTREAAISHILASLGPDDRVVSTTGMASREIYELRELKGEGHSKDFLTVGSMGHAIMIALGIAKFRTKGSVFCIDGDGAAIMHLGSLGIAGVSGVKNLRHIVINNGAHDSVGGQPTIGFALHFDAIAQSLGYKACFRADTEAELKAALVEISSSNGPAFLEVRVRTGHRKELGRPKTSPVENKLAFMENL